MGSHFTASTVLCVKYFMVCSKFVYVQIKTKIMSHITNQRPLHTSSIVIYLSYSIYQKPSTLYSYRAILIDWLGLVIFHQFWAFRISTIIVINLYIANSVYNVSISFKAVVNKLLRKDEARQLLFSIV